MKQAKLRSTTWGTSYDKYGDPSGEFTASREGLLYLRDRIDEALEKGEARIEEGRDFDFERIRTDKVHPFDQLAPDRFGNGIFNVLILSMGVLAAALMVYGAIQFWEHFVK
jgi:hypothetical protein